uniref:Protein kinase domain-containing protein n=1 Tax=Musa acuminata subsp. malaccensis TaxID=214687 RepID=A0A804JZI7_MUSAM
MPTAIFRAISFLSVALLLLPVSGLNHEGTALLAWLSSFNSSLSSALFSSWDPTHSNPCRWAFVSCSSSGLVSEICIRSISLHTTFPSQILSFRSLANLVLYDTNITGEIPRMIANLTSLLTLDLRFNALSGKIPPGMGNLSSLRVLELVDNQLTGTIPAEIGRLSSLEIFRAGGNSGISGEIPPSISNCKGLVLLGLADTAVSGRIPSGIGELRNLRTLSIYTSNLFTGDVPESIGNCTGLTVMDLSLNYLTGEVPASFAKLMSLEVFLLSYNNISGRIPGFVGNLSRLSQLELDNNRFSGELPTGIGQLKELTQFFAWQNQLHGNVPSELGGCGKLESLDLSYNFLTGRMPAEIGHLRNLSFLELSENMISGTIPSSLEHLRQLNVIDLSRNRIAGPVPETLGLCGDLEFLDMSSNRIAGPIPEEIGYLQGLDIVLNLSWNYLSGPLPRGLSNLSKLTSLDVSHNMLTGSLDVLGGLDNLLPAASFAGNQQLLATDVDSQTSREEKEGRPWRLAMGLHSLPKGNIVRLLGCCMTVAWESRYKIALGAAQGLAYLHHDCNPPIIHRDIKARNILVGLEFEPYLADFGLAKPVDRSGRTMPCGVVAGSYGYIAPDVELDCDSMILTGLQPSDARIQGAHIVDWVRRELRAANSPAAAVLDGSLRNQTDVEVQEMVQVLGVALLCVNPAPEERPSMRDVAALLREIRIVSRHLQEAGDHPEKGFENCANAAACSSFSRASVPMISSSSSTSSSL